MVCTKHSKKIESGRVYTTRNAHSILHATHLVTRKCARGCTNVKQFHKIGILLLWILVEWESICIYMHIYVCRIMWVSSFWIFFSVLFWRFFRSSFLFISVLQDPWIGPDRKLWSAANLSVCGLTVSLGYIYKGFSAHILQIYTIQLLFSAGIRFSFHRFSMNIQICEYE